MGPPLSQRKFVAECTACDYHREYDERSKRLSGAVAGHTRNTRCTGEVNIREEIQLICRSCGYRDGQEGANVRAVGDDPRFPEDTLCGVCETYRIKRRIAQGITRITELGDQ